MFLSKLVRISVLGLLLFFCNYSLALEKVHIGSEPVWIYKVSADFSRKPAAKTISSGYYLELSDHQVNLSNNSEYVHFIRHIVNESGIQNASEVSVTFSPEFQQVVFHKISLVRNGKVVSEVQAGQIKVVQEETDASDFQYNGLKRAFVLLKDVRKEDQIEAAYSIVGFNPVFTNKYSTEIYFSKGTAVCNYFETIIVPQNRKLYFHYFNKAPSPVEQLQGGLQIYHWNNPTFKLWESQPGVPSWFDNSPRISVTEFENWEEVINWGLQIFNNYQYQLPADLKSKIAKWQTIAKEDKDVFASLAIQFVQDQVRYLGLELGRYTHQPHSPATVFQQRFGDCKDKALLLAIILQSNNIPAYVALVNTDKTEKLNESAPATDQFDHAIVAIERSTGYIFVDPTDSRQRGELANLYVPAYGYSLVLRKGESNLRHIDPGFLNETSIIETLDVQFKDTSRFAVISTYEGGSADKIRSSYADMSTSEIEDSYIHYYTKKYDGIQQSNPIDLSDDSVANKIIVKESYAIPALWHPDENERESFSFYAQPIYEKIPNPANVYKNAPVALDFPLTLNYKMIINMPESWVFNFDALHIKNDSYQFDFVPVINGSRISIRYYLKTFKDNIPIADLSKYKSDYSKIQKVLDFALYRTSPTTTSGSQTDDRVNWLMLFITLMTVAGLAVLLKYLDGRRVAVSYSAGGGREIGGWLIVLCITLAASGILQVFNFISSGILKNSLWTSLGETGGVRFQFVLVVQLLLSLLWICGNVAVLYWFIMRRDIFPQMFLWFAGSVIAGQLIIAILVNVTSYPALFGETQASNTVGFARSIVYGLGWGAYVINSKRVKETFVQ